MTSLASVKGPSVTVSCPLEIRTRVLRAVGARPPFPSIVRFWTASSARMLIASISSLGGGPEFSGVLTNIMNFIVISPFDFWVVGWAFRTLRLPEPSLHLNVERGAVKSTSRTLFYFVDHRMHRRGFQSLRILCARVGFHCFTKLCARTAPATRETQPRPPGHRPGNPTFPAPGEARSLHCRKRGSATPIPPLLPST